MGSTSARNTAALCFCIVVVLAPSLPASAQPTAARFPAMENDDAWRLLPRENPPLPAWARTLAHPLPKTTGMMLELDYVHRAKNPLGPVLAGKLRWMAAETIGCDYAKRYAEADLRQCGLGEEQLAQLRGKELELDEPDGIALTFARKMTRAAHEVTDDEVAQLLRVYGPERVVGIVHTLAYANFQNRIFLALAVKVEQGGPFPPLDYRADSAKRMKIETPARPAWEFSKKGTPGSTTISRPAWNEWSFADLEKARAKQKERKARIPLPDPSRLSKLPPEVQAQATKIVWTNISMGYQPLLTKSWFDCMRTFQLESKLDRVFANSMFWVITRSNECFY